MPKQDGFNGSVFVFPDDYAPVGRNELVKEFVNGGKQMLMDTTGDLRESDMVSRKAEESANRRHLAASWMQDMVGPFALSAEPSEEEFRLCLRNGTLLCKLINKVQPGSVPRIVEGPCNSGEVALSAYQYFENVRNFLTAAEDLHLTPFEASDLEETSYGTGSVARVVDCILNLKSYHDWRENGGSGQWKHGVKQHTVHKNMLTFAMDEGGKCLFTKSNSMNGMGARKRCILPNVDFLGETQLLLPEEPPDLAGSEALRARSEKNGVISDFSAKQIISSLESEDWENGVLRSFDSLETQSPGSLSNTIRALLSEKQPHEIPIVVEFMLQRVMEDYRRRFFSQSLQLKKLKNALKEALNRGTELTNICATNDGKHDNRMIFDQLKLLKDLKEASQNTREEVLAMRQNWKMEVENLESQLKGLVSAASGYQKVLSENRKLYNEVQDLKGSIRVYCRVRPLLSGDLERKTTVEFIGENGDIMISNPKRQGKDACRNFRFNKVFDTTATQEKVFLDTQPLIRSVLDGYNVCIFAYGQTGSGKTYTMSGPTNATEELWGVNYRALNDLFLISQSRKGYCTYEIRAQMVEIYNEQVRDLLTSDGPPTKKLEIRSNIQQNGLTVPDASMLAVASTNDVLELMDAGLKNRATGTTALNERSSRSHSVLTIYVQGKDLVSGSILRGCLHLIDLAGSERVNKSEATGDRLKEAQHINKSLSALGDVISALSQKNGHVPYRNSKLTQLLQDSLGGQAKTLMFVHINPDVDSFGETMSTLKFAERVASIELGAARSNKETGELQELKEQIMILKDSLSKKDADLDRLLLLRNVRESATSIEKQRRRANTDEQESRTRKQFAEGRTREGSPPVRDRGRRFSPPGHFVGFPQPEFDRALSPSKAEAAYEQNKRRSIRGKQLPSPKSPCIEEFAPKSPYRERQHRTRHSQSKAKSCVFLVHSPVDERLKSPDVDGFINKEAELSRDSPVCSSRCDLPTNASIVAVAYNNHSAEDTSPPVNAARSLPSVFDFKEDPISPSEMNHKDLQTREHDERMGAASEAGHSVQETSPVQAMKTNTSDEKGNRSTTQKSIPRIRKGQPVACVRRRSIVTSRTESAVIKSRTSTSQPFSARHTTLECHGKPAFSRQLLSIETGISSKASKRYPWMLKQIKLSAMLV